MNWTMLEWINIDIAMTSKLCPRTPKVHIVSVTYFKYGIEKVYNAITPHSEYIKNPAINNHTSQNKALIRTE